MPYALLDILGFRFPISQPHPLRTLTTFGVTATVNGTLINMKVLCMAYAKASWVQMPISECQRTLLSSRSIMYTHSHYHSCSSSPPP